MMYKLFQGLSFLTVRTVNDERVTAVHNVFHSLLLFLKFKYFSAYLVNAPLISQVSLLFKMMNSYEWISYAGRSVILP